MPAVNDTIVFGAKETGEALRKLGKRIAANVVKRALRDGGAVIRDLARQKAPVRTGALAKSIVSEADKSIEGEFRSKVTVSRRGYYRNAKGTLQREKEGQVLAKGQRIYPRRYAHLVEFGTRAHSIGHKSRLKYDKEGKIRKGGGLQHGLMHPGAKAKPFMRPAYDEGKLEAIKRIAQRFATEIPKEAAAVKARARSNAT